MSEKQAKSQARGGQLPDVFREYMRTGWAPRDAAPPERSAVADPAAQRRDAVSRQFPGERLVIPAGGLKVRSNDTDYVFRPHSAFAHLTGFGSDREPDAVLVLEPREGGGHDAVVYFRPLAGRDSDNFFADGRYGEFWVGPRATLEDVEAEFGLTARHLDEFADAVAKDAGEVGVRVVRDADADVTVKVDQVRATEGEAQDAAETRTEADEELARFLSTLRMIKDEYEIEQLRQAVEATGHGFEAVIAELAEAVRRGRGERWAEGVFGLYARHEGNGVGYDSICASGDHANTLHWTRNTGDLREEDLLLIDAGVELDSLYTADITRTLPVSGKFSEAQRKVYEAVYAAQQAGIDAVKPGNKFSDIHAAAMEVIAKYVAEWDMLPDGVDLEITLDADKGQFHRRWMVHGTSHHLGLDVHDCALALREDYLDAELKPGMILTVEPGLYFKADDELVPEQLRGIGVRIEDDVLVTQDGHDVLSGHLPRTADDVEAWIARLRADRD
ncbi:aminopeptidase P family protein [Flexivirga meconopsidis]|uniref:aminopeptidase P family protein n=1 Tax=Flexivirga meconopsidis TaxID=2977121 RepID=UPI00223F0B18|nr:aminopeptidase P family protein [Flexivirga meconopsidis]